MYREGFPSLGYILISPPEEFLSPRTRAGDSQGCSIWSPTL